jgi:hypothetical protein
VHLDDAVLGRADQVTWWQPRPGVHRIAVQDGAGRVVDRILFTVR